MNLLAHILIPFAGLHLFCWRTAISDIRRLRRLSREHHAARASWWGSRAVARALGVPQ